VVSGTKRTRGKENLEVEEGRSGTGSEGIWETPGRRGGGLWEREEETKGGGCFTGSGRSEGTQENVLRKSCLQSGVASWDLEVAVET